MFVLFRQDKGGNSAIVIGGGGQCSIYSEGDSLFTIMWESPILFL